MSNTFVPSACCAAGKVSNYVATGTTQYVGGLNTYVAPIPEGANKRQGHRLVVLCSDVFGWEASHIRELADRYAKSGFVAVVPDLFNGGAVDPCVMERMLPLVIKKKNAPPKSLLQKVWGWLTAIWTVIVLARYFIPFLIRNGKQAKKAKVVNDFVIAAKKQFGCNKAGMIGYCYGGYFCLDQAKNESSPCDAVAPAHTKVRVPEDLVSLCKPVLFICASNDMAFGDKARLNAEAILSQRHDANKFVFRFYPDTYHGFAVRGDDSDPVIQKAKEDAFQVSVSFFNERL